MQLKYYGPRGSLPTPGRDTLKYGGNTTCLSLRAGDRQIIVDGGSGLRLLGHALMQGACGRGRGTATFFWTHFHWDHIQGFPFFVPNFIPGNRFEHYGPPETEEVLVRQQTFVTFPVEFHQMPSRHEFHVLPESGSVRLGALTVRFAPMRHPGGGRTYRFEHEGKSVVFATDVEHMEEGSPAPLVELCRGTDLLIYDAQYTPEEYAKGKTGWGHSTWEHGVALARAAGAKRLHLYHHDQLHSDRFLETRLLTPARRAFPRTWLAREGWTVNI